MSPAFDHDGSARAAAFVSQNTTETVREDSFAKSLAFSIGGIEATPVPRQDSCRLLKDLSFSKFYADDEKGGAIPEGDEDGKSGDGAVPEGEECIVAHGYRIGDEGKPEDMVKGPPGAVALRPGDPAFIRRSDGRWTLARVQSTEADAVRFVVGADGKGTKVFRRKRWGTFVRTLQGGDGPGERGDEKRKSSF